MSLPKTVRVVGAALLDDVAAPTRMLVARRSAPASLAGLWEFPGGKTEPGESARGALARELSEELGIEAAVGTEVLGPGDDGWPLSGAAVMRVFLATVSAGTPEPLEDHSELRWMSLSAPEDIMALDWIPADVPIVHRVLSVLGHPPGPHPVDHLD